MAKELPYFKFEPNQWENGNIQMLSREDKGLFIDLCCMYWSRLGDVPLKLAIQKLCAGNATALNSLCDEKIIEILDGNIFIKFLSEQLNEFEDTSKQNSKNARMNFKYGLIDYSINKDIAAGTKFLSAIKDFKKSNIIAEDFKDYSATNLDALTEEDISAELNAILKETDEGAITKPIMIGGKLHVFYVAKKDLVESSEYLKEKEKIRNQLFEKAVVLETKDWLIRERNKHFIKNNL